MKIIKDLIDRYRRYRTRRWELKLWRADVVERQKNIEAL